MSDPAGGVTLNGGHLDHFIAARSIYPCMICGKDTRFIEVHFEGPLHPGACTDAMWKEYDEALRASPAGPGTDQQAWG